MTQKHVLTLCLPLFLLSAPCCVGPDVWALAESYKKPFKEQLLLIIDTHPKYLWGGAGDVTRGLDCSGYVYLAAKRAGIPGISRTTSRRMSLGLGGWSSMEVNFDDADECDLLFWTFKEERPAGHVGVLLFDKDGRTAAAHAGSGRGVTLQPLAGPLRRNLIKIRRLIIGD